MNIIAILLKEADTDSYRLTSLPILQYNTSEQILRGKLTHYMGASEKWIIHPSETRNLHKQTSPRRLYNISKQSQK